MIRLAAVIAIVGGAWCGAVNAAAEEKSSANIRAVVPRASEAPVIDGSLGDAEYAGALCTPIEYFHRDYANRAAQFYYLWDDEAFYVGLRTLDAKPFSQESPLWEGDAVEWYFDVRRGDDFLSQSWPKGANAGAVHCFFTAMHEGRVAPRFALRPGYEQAIARQGVKTAARRTEEGLEIEFKLPWSNFPDFRPRAGEVIGLDAELSYSDGGERSYRSFVFGSPLSVQQPANLAQVKLVDRLERQHWAASGPVMLPMRVDVPWSQPTRPHVTARIAVPPGLRDAIGRIVFKLTDLEGQPLGEFETEDEVSLSRSGQFMIREAHWPADHAAPGRYQAVAIVFDSEGVELTRVAPRLVSVNLEPGY